MSKGRPGDRWRAEEVEGSEVARVKHVQGGSTVLLAADLNMAEKARERHDKKVAGSAQMRDFLDYANRS